jgi:ribosomal protein S25
LIKELKYVEIVEKTITKKKITIGVAEHIIRNMEERCGGAV